MMKVMIAFIMVLGNKIVLIKTIIKMKPMNLKSKILLLTIAPLICVTAIITYLSFISAKELARQELGIFEYNLIKVKKEALKDQTDLAFSAIKNILQNTSLNNDEAQTKVKTLLSSLIYGEEGYFFVYDKDGVNLVHPIQPDFVGQNLWEYKDASGNPLIQILTQAAHNGGGYHRYIWAKPSNMRQEEKISYAMMIDRWQWMFGTGLYLDDVYLELDKAKTAINNNIHKSFLTVLFIIIAAIILVILLSLAINLHEHKLADNRLKALAQRFIRLQVSERRKFSRELHDGINQLLVSCKFRIELALDVLNKKPTSKDIRPHLEMADSVIIQSIKEIRQISHNLRPTSLDDLGLKVALGTLIEQFSQRTQIDVETNLEFDENTISDESEITLYRLAQECLTNIEKHAEASKVSIYLNQTNQCIEFKCIDNGVGFHQNKKSLQGIGLRNMQERIELISGNFNCRSHVGQGTEITASLIDLKSHI